MRLFIIFFLYFIFSLLCIKVKADEYVHTDFNSTGTIAVQALSFSGVPTSGTFNVVYTDSVGPHIFQLLPYSSTSATIQTKLRLYTALASSTVAGSIASNTIQVTFTGVDGAVQLLDIANNTLVASATPVTITPSTITPGVPTSQPSTTHWVQLTSSLGYGTNYVTAYNSTNSILLLGKGAAGAEAGVALLFPSQGLRYSSVLGNGERISVKSVSGTPTNGFLDLNFDRNY